MPLNKTCQQADSVKIARHSKMGENGSYKTSKTLGVEKIQPFLSQGKMPQKVMFITIISQYHKTNVEDRKLHSLANAITLFSLHCNGFKQFNRYHNVKEEERKTKLRSIEMHFLASTRFCKVQNNIAEVCISSQYSICREMYFNALLCCNKVDLAEDYTFISFFACVGRFLCFCRHLKGRRRQQGLRK